MKISRKKKKPEIPEQYGEYECPQCKKVFHQKSKYDGHIGGAHRKGIVANSKIVKCKKCSKPLVKDQNWSEWAYKQGNLICKDCKRIMNRESYHRNKWKKAYEKEKVK